MASFIDRIFKRKSKKNNRASLNIDSREIIQNLGYIHNIKEILSFKIVENEENDVTVKIQVLVDKKIKLYELQNIKIEIKNELKEQNINNSIVEFITDKARGIKCKVTTEK